MPTRCTTNFICSTTTTCFQTLERGLRCCAACATSAMVCYDSETRTARKALSRACCRVRQKAAHGGASMTSRFATGLKSALIFDRVRGNACHMLLQEQDLPWKHVCIPYSAPSKTLCIASALLSAVLGPLHSCFASSQTSAEGLR
jgi:hypothetical protein